MKKLLFVLLTGLCLHVYAQNTPPFRKEIDAFRKKDSLQMPAKGMILFVGSSSFTKWTDVQSYFPGYAILNRGFGGSSLPDVIRYADEIIYPYQPKQIVIYCGENDIAASDTVTAQTVLKRFTQLFGMIRSHLGNVPVAFISVKPSPSRRKFRPVVIEANKLIRDFLRRKANTAYINVYDAMLNSDGSEKGGIFVQDSLHMNAKGYAIWQPIIQRKLKK
ncbi:GDSL-type esterase/lipase family protein [Sediminibacterium soli]|uniref:GDSL-type esterase/lipase family protein n=1 Tax=Sediminibacterium soli TaxID=2698829 RepID=UPI00137A3B87|nr:GDSL-type esterase/lipase family protein [Sediminibacterium soli]NCI45332.1 G-D-S-L family lipolytic protein [Sediminibacterium soli]